MHPLTCILFAIIGSILGFSRPREQKLVNFLSLSTLRYYVPYENGILNKPIEYVKNQTAVNGRPPNYPFCSRYEHTMRVYRWAIKLQAKVGGDLEIITLAALLHDIGWDDERPHNEVGAELAVEYLDSNDKFVKKLKGI